MKVLSPKFIRIELLQQLQHKQYVRRVAEIQAKEEAQRKAKEERDRRYLDKREAKGAP